MAERPGRAFWLFALVAVPVVAMVLSFLVAPHWTLTRYTALPYGALSGGGAAVALVPLLFRLPLAARLRWALAGGVAAGIASVFWSAVFVVAYLASDCVIGGCE